MMIEPLKNFAVFFSNIISFSSKFHLLLTGEKKVRSEENWIKIVFFVIARFSKKESGKKERTKILSPVTKSAISNYRKNMFKKAFNGLPSSISTTPLFVN